MEREEVRNSIKSFYEKNPFPDYDDFDNIAVLKEKAERGMFAKLLNEQIKGDVLEVGCGTGQLSNYLSLKHKVIGIDMCENSLKLAKEFRDRNNLTTEFYQMDLFNISLSRMFTYVICNGVLHHTHNAWDGFRRITELVEPGGYIVIGLYNKYGRFHTNLRRFFYRFYHPKLKDKQLTYFLDQYKNPHETAHTFGEILKWFDKSGFEFMNSIPKIKGSFLEGEKLFTPHSRGNIFSRFWLQFNMIGEDSENGFFMMIGRRR